MDQKQAIKVLIDAVHMANKAGAYSLSDSKTIALAVEAFTVQPPVEAKPETAKE